MRTLFVFLSVFVPYTAATGTCYTNSDASCICYAFVPHDINTTATVPTNTTVTPARFIISNQRSEVDCSLFCSFQICDRLKPESGSRSVWCGGAVRSAVAVSDWYGSVWEYESKCNPKYSMAQHERDCHYITANLYVSSDALISHRDLIIRRSIDVIQPIIDIDLWNACGTDYYGAVFLFGGSATVCIVAVGCICYCCFETTNKKRSTASSWAAIVAAPTPAPAPAAPTPAPAPAAPTPTPAQKPRSTTRFYHGDRTKEINTFDQIFAKLDREKKEARKRAELEREAKRQETVRRAQHRWQERQEREEQERLEREEQERLEREERERLEREERKRIRNRLIQAKKEMDAKAAAEQAERSAAALRLMDERVAAAEQLEWENAQIRKETQAHTILPAPPAPQDESMPGPPPPGSACATHIEDEVDTVKV